MLVVICVTLLCIYVDSLRTFQFSNTMIYDGMVDQVADVGCVCVSNTIIPSIMSTVRLKPTPMTAGQCKGALEKMASHSQYMGYS